MHHAVALILSVLIFSGATLHAALAQEPPSGAMSCSGCHSSQSDPAMTLADLSAADIIQAMTDFSSGTRPATIMDRIARGFNETEIQAIADWLEESNK